MNIISLLGLLLSLAFATTSAMDHKKGFLVGGGLNLIQYKFPVSFDGETRKEVDEKSLLAGPQLQAGYDVVLGSTILLGLRAEGLQAETLGMSFTKNSKLTQETKGKSSSLNTLLRIGYVREFTAGSPVGDVYPMVMEIFLEGGMGSGKHSFSLDYSYNSSGVSEQYKEDIAETFKSQIFAAGLNLTSKGGSFFELKLMRQSVKSNKIKRTGSSQLNGGSVIPFSLKDQNTSPDALTSLVLSIGHHY